jgi:dihydroorotase/N-acyl-D-amino-acid deacylase
MTRGLLLAASAAVVAVAALVPAQSGYDVIIRNARVMDGTGNPWFLADIALRGDAIAGIASRISEPAARTIEAGGLVVAPGFIDIHVHAFLPAPAVHPIVEVPTADNFVRQGVTTLIGGPDGSAPIPLRPVFDQLEKTGIVPNLGSFVGHGSIREAVMGTVNRAPTLAELEQMRGLVRGGMRDGAFGMSTGLFYVPATFSRTDEVIELARVAGEMGGIHISHMRDETRGVVQSVRETIEIGEKGGLPTQVTHHKTIGKAAWGKTEETLRLIEEARARGVDATADVYPYTASSTAIRSALIPVWAQEGGPEQTLRRLRDPETRRRILRETFQLLLEERGAGDPRAVQISQCAWNPALAGKRLDEISVSRGKTASLEDAADTVLWIVENGGCGGIYHVIDEADVQRVIAHPASMIASDGTVVPFGRASPHPRSYGTFARVLGRYVRELEVLSLEAAIRKMTSFPAQRIGLTDRGVLRPGMKADLVVFDPDRVRDLATYENPHQYAEGVKTVVINGQIAFEDGTMTSARPGRILRGPGFAR